MFMPLAQTRSLRDWFTPLDGCPHCGYPYEREPGYYLMAIWAVNYGVGGLIGLVIYGVLEIFYEMPVGWLLAAVMTPVILFNFFFSRHSKSIFLAMDLLIDPHERRQGGDDDGDARLTPPPQPPTTPTLAPQPEAPFIEEAGVVEAGSSR